MSLATGLLSRARVLQMQVLLVGLASSNLGSLVCERVPTATTLTPHLHHALHTHSMPLPPITRHRCLTYTSTPQTRLLLPYPLASVSYPPQPPRQLPCHLNHPHTFCLAHCFVFSCAFRTISIFDVLGARVRTFCGDFPRPWHTLAVAYPCHGHPECRAPWIHSP